MKNLQIEKLKQEIAEREAKIKELKMEENKKDYIEVPELGIKVQTKTTKMTYIEAEKYCKENNCKMLNVLQAGFIYDNGLIKGFCEEWEWLEHYSKKTREKGYGCSALLRSWGLGDRLVVDGYGWDDGDGGHAFGVRFVYPITSKAHKSKSKIKNNDKQ